MNTVIALLSLTGIASFIYFSLRNANAYKMDMAVREAREEHMKSAYDYGVAPRIFP
jgi:hypothetical protein